MENYESVKPPITKGRTNSSKHCDPMYHYHNTRLQCGLLVYNISDCYEDLIIYVIAFMAVNLRDVVTIFSRITDMKQKLLDRWNKCSDSYVNAAALFLRITITVYCTSAC